MSLKIYFCGSIRAGRQDVDIYADLIQKLAKYGKVLTAFVGSKVKMNILVGAEGNLLSTGGH